MKYKALPGRVTISRPVYGDGKEVISIQVRDVNSRTTFVEVEIPLENFSKAITGLAETECDFKVHHLDRVGKKKVTKSLDIPMPYESRFCKETAAKLAMELSPYGYTPSLHFDSKGSFYELHGKPYARTTATKWVSE